METLLVSIGNLLNTLGATIVLPVVIALLGIVLGLSVDRAIRSGLLSAVALVGIFLTVGMVCWARH